MAEDAVGTYIQAELDFSEYFEDDDDNDLREENQPRASFEYTYQYNIRYETPDPFFDDEINENLDIYDRILTQAVNLRTLDMVERDVDLPIPLSGEPQCTFEPKLTITNYFRGEARVDDGTPYKPDATYCQSSRRKVNGTDIQLKDLHMTPTSGRRAGEEFRHVALIGPAGCGKTVLAKRYARMVLNNQVPELHFVDVVHYLDVSKMYIRGTPVIPAEVLLNRMLIFKVLSNNFMKIQFCISFRMMFHLQDKKVHEYSYAWMRRNSDRILFIFDNADEVVNKFRERVSVIDSTSEVHIHEVMENMINGRFLPGCRTLIGAREWACRNMNGDHRPNRIVMVHPMSDNTKHNLMQSLPGDDLASVIQRHFPMTFHFADNVLFMYFAMYAMIHGNNHDQSEITRDVMLIANLLQYFLRSKYASQELEDKLTDFKRLCFDMTSAGTVSFCYRQLESYNDLKDEDMAELVTIAPCQRHAIYYRLFPNDFSYFFSSDTVQEFLTACFIAEMDLKKFEDFSRNKMHTDQWLVIRRFLGAVLLNEKTRENALYFLERTPHICDMSRLMKSSLDEQAKKLDTLTPFQRYELLATLYECGDSVRDIIKHRISSISLPGVALSPSDLFIISWIDTIMSEPQMIDVSLGKDINLAEFDLLASSALAKPCEVRLDIARMNITLDHIEVLRNALLGQQKRVHQTLIQVNKNSSEEIMKSMPAECSTSSRHNFDIKAIQVPSAEVAPTQSREDEVKARPTSGVSSSSVTRQKREKQKGKHCKVM